ncbi:hypothetical protein CYMTET_39218 [Cymbomonas tetramitiformis]|uniref:Protein RFT1 homolog n=1 Tax=Cymbomonas tetramitiformis TaxID=36881 RepID=A0AAE0F4Q0_9CHLO|nr:hypothetical protein CYMTET_39218 [Cymbomonas tetramitiformis]
MNAQQIKEAGGKINSVFAQSFAYIMGAQILARLVPFAINTLVARRMTPRDLGVSTVHFSLALTVVLTSREGFRRACLRGSDVSWTEQVRLGLPSHREAVAVASLCIPLGVLLSALVAATAQQLIGGSAAERELYLSGLHLHRAPLLHYSYPFLLDTLHLQTCSCSCSRTCTRPCFCLCRPALAPAPGPAPGPASASADLLLLLLLPTCLFLLPDLRLL